MPKLSQNISKRQRLEDSAARLRSVFGSIPGEKKKKQSAEEVLGQAWEMAEDITAFAVKYLSHLMCDQETGETVRPADFHRDLYQILLTKKYAAIAAPREHAKSTVVGLIFVLYCVCYKLRRFIVLISDTQFQAALQLAGIKEELETNHELRQDFGDLRGESKWDVNDARTSSGVTLAARGAGQSLRGLRYRLYRPDLVICDDLENEEDVANPDSREKLLRWFLGTVLNLGKGCQVFVIGTILHYDSLLSKLLDPEEFKSFEKRRYQAIDQEWTPESLLWPAKWPLQVLKEKAALLGSVIFNQEWRNLPVASDQQIFPEAWFKRHAYTKEEVAHKTLFNVTYYDPAISQKRSADFFAGVTLGVDEKGVLYVRRAEQSRIPYLQQKTFILRREEEERPVVIGIEDIAYQSALKQEMEDAMRTSGRYTPVVGVTNLTDKLLRISMMSSLVENGTIRFLMDGSQATLISQLMFLGKIKDDLADALQGAVQLARRYNFKPAMATSDVQVGNRSNTNRLDDQTVNKMRVGSRANTARNDAVQRDRRSVWR